MSPMSSTPSWWRHRNGGVYCLIHIAIHQCADSALDMQRIAVYQGADSRVWTRPLSEFLDGRFVQISEPAPGPRLACGCPDDGGQPIVRGASGIEWCPWCSQPEENFRAFVRGEP